jgi:Concanavalin A-like lectin/glucanases superfamily/Divergent InlB B-repeat domain/Fibronectin type III domain
MNKKPPFSIKPAFGTKFRNLHAVPWSRFLATVASLLVASLSLGHSAQSVTLAWDASSDATIAGYKLRYGTTSGNPNQIVDVGRVTTSMVSNLNDATTYYFTVVGYNSAGVESQPSNQISYTTPGQSSTTYLLTVNDGTGDGNYAPNAQVAVNANSPPAGQEFDIWTGDYQILANRSSASTTATMPSGNVSITATYVPAPGSGANPPNQVLALSFREGSGTAVADSSGSNHNGTLMNGPTWIAGKFGNAISLDGSNDYVSVINSDTLNFGTGDFTIAAWIKRQAIGAEDTILSKTATGSWTGGGKEFFINGDDSRLSFGVFNVDEVFSTGTIVNDGLWHHVAVSFNSQSSTVTFFIDGVAKGGGTLGMPADVGGHVVKIGGHPLHYFGGQLDEFRIFNRALSSGEVQSIMNTSIDAGQ